MSLHVFRQDVTACEADAVVNSIGDGLGGVDLAFRKKASFAEKLFSLDGPPDVGEAKVTAAQGIPATYIIHTSVPRWRGDARALTALRSCVFTSLAWAKKKRCRSVAFPLLGAGRAGFPVMTALRVFDEAVSAFLRQNEMDVYLCLYGNEAWIRAQALYDDVRDFLGANFIAPEPPPLNPGAFRTPAAQRKASDRRASGAKPAADACAGDLIVMEESAAPAPPLSAAFSLDDLLSTGDESFSTTLLRMIDASGMTDVECYKKAGVDRKLFSKIRSDESYRPKKPTVLAFAFALELDPDEAELLLKRAGYALSHASRFDLIAEYFLQKRVYDLQTVNETLFAYDQPLLGSF